MRLMTATKLPCYVTHLVGGPVTFAVQNLRQLAPIILLSPGV